MASKEDSLLKRSFIGLVDIYRVLVKYPVIPIILLLPIVVWGIFGPFIWPHDPTSINVSTALQPPAWMTGGNWSHLLGTDKLGRDLLSRLMEGARASLVVSVFGVFFAGIIGVTLGILAGYFRGKTESIIMSIVDIWMSIPSMLFVIILAGVMGGGLTTITLCISLVFWTGYARVVRAETLGVMQQDYVALAKVTGCNVIRIVLRHVLPNLINTITVMATLQIGSAIMIEAAVTFLGMGIQPPNTAWGLIISDGRSYMSTAWWVPTFAGLAIMSTVLGANLLGDWLRNALDPKTRQSM